MGRSKNVDDPEIMTPQVDVEKLQHKDMSKITSQDSEPQENVLGDHFDNVPLETEKQGNVEESIRAENSKKEAPGTVSIFRLFAFADPLDYLLLTIGSLSAIVHGAAMPIFFLFFGQLIDGFGANVDNPTKTANTVNKVYIRASRMFSTSDQHEPSLLRIAFFLASDKLMICCGFQYALYMLYLGVTVWVASWGGELLLSRTTKLSSCLST